MIKGQIEKKVQYGGKKSSVGWKRIPNTNEEGTNRKKKSNMEGINWKKNLYNRNKEGTNRKKKSNIEKKWWYKKEIMKGQIETDTEKNMPLMNERKNLGR